MIPAWLMMIIKMAISIGSPYLLSWLKEKIKDLPPVVIDLINELIKSLVDPTVNNREAKKRAKAKLKECSGTMCPPQTKNDK